MPFLEIITRTYKRPALLANNIASLSRQTNGDYLHVFLPDEVGRGVAWANARLAEQAPHLKGEYIWILDDDDECNEVALIEQLMVIADKHDPDVIMLKMDHDFLGVKPEPDRWQNPPVEGHIGCSAYVVRRPVWQKHALVWADGRYQSDFDFISSIFADNPVVYWHDVVASRVQRISYGAPE